MPTSPYSAPTTPIASAKRPRIGKDMKSPTRGTALGGNNSKERVDSKSSSSDTHTTGSSSSSSSGGPRGSKKALFSPLGQPSSQGVNEEEHEEAGGKGAGAHSGRSSRQQAADAEAKETRRQREEKERKDAADEAEEEEERRHKQQQEEEEEVFNPYQFISGLPDVTTIARNEVMVPPLPPAGGGSSSKPTLVLDLDETLVHCTVEPIDNPDLIFPVTFNGTLYDVYVRKRPYLNYFLEAVSLVYEVVVFTASQRVYADVLLDLLDPKKQYVQHRLFRESCVMVQGNFLKDLHVIGRDYSRMALVDNSPHAYGFQIENGIPIESWFDDDTDTELLKLVGFLRRAFAAEDVRTVIKEHFKTDELVDRARRGEEIDLSHAPPF